MPASAGDDLINHECIKDLSIKISIEFQRPSQSFPFQRIFRQLNFDPGSGVRGGGRATFEIQIYIFYFVFTL